MKWPTPDPDNEMTWGKCFLMWLMCLAMCASLALFCQVAIWAEPSGTPARLDMMLRDGRLGIFYVMVPMTILCILFRYVPGKARLKEARRQQYLKLKEEFGDE